MSENDNEQRMTIISFDPFFRMQELKGMPLSYISKRLDIPVAILNKMQRREDVPFDVIQKICHAMECQPGDIMEANTIYVIPAKDKE